jgi:integrase
VKPKRPTYKAEEVAALEKGVRSWLRPIITTLAWMGMRIDELCNLRWKDIDLVQRVIHIRVQEGWIPKGRRDRTVPMHPKVEWVMRQQAIGQKVFRGPRGGRITETRCLACLKLDQRKLNLAEGDLHGFRRFFATTMMQAGVSAEP